MILGKGAINVARKKRTEMERERVKERLKTVHWRKSREREREVDCQCGMKG